MFQLVNQFNREQIDFSGLSPLLHSLTILSLMHTIASLTASSVSLFWEYFSSARLHSFHFSIFYNTKLFLYELVCTLKVFFRTCPQFCLNDMFWCAGPSLLRHLCSVLVFFNVLNQCVHKLFRTAIIILDKFVSWTTTFTFLSVFQSRKRFGTRTFRTANHCCLNYNALVTSWTALVRHNHQVRDSEPKIVIFIFMFCLWTSPLSTIQPNYIRNLELFVFTHTGGEELFYRPCRLRTSQCTRIWELYFRNSLVSGQSSSFYLVLFILGVPIAKRK